MYTKVHKLLIVAPSLGTYGGMEAFMIALADSVNQWPEFEAKLCFKLVKGATVHEDLKRAAEKVCKDVSFVSRGSKKLLQLIASSDIVHAQNTPPDVILLSKLLAKKIFLTVHNYRRPNLNLHNILWRFSINLANRRWFNSRFVWSTWEPNGKSKKSDVFPTVSALPTLYFPPEKRKGFLFIGRWIPNKGIEEILKAYAKNNFNTEEWPLTILGDGQLKPTVYKLISELKLKDVNIPGFVDAATKDKYLASTKWLLAPANTKEDLGLTPIEARSVSVPSIVTNDGGLPEAGGPAALVAQPGDVEDLARCMKMAVEMNDEEYASRSRQAKQSLDDFIRPMEFYRHAYLN